MPQGTLSRMQSDGKGEEKREPKNPSSVSTIGVRRGGVEKDIPTAPPFRIHLKAGKLEEGEYRKPLLFFGKNGEVDATTRF